MLVNPHILINHLHFLLPPLLALVPAVLPARRYGRNELYIVRISLYKRGDVLLHGKRRVEGREEGKGRKRVGSEGFLSSRACQLWRDRERRENADLCFGARSQTASTGRRGPVARGRRRVESRREEEGFGGRS